MQPGRWVGLAVVFTALLGALAIPGAQAAPDEQAKLKKLREEAAELTKAYRGEIVSLEDTQKLAENSSGRVARLKRSLAAAERKLTMFAQTAYMGGGIDDSLLLMPQADLGASSIVSYLSSEKTERVTSIKTLIAEEKKAAKDADGKIAQLEQHIKELKAKQHEVEQKMAKFGFQVPGSSSGLTQRLITLRAEVMQTFPMPFSVGCLRVGDPGEHGKGRACDFMMSGGGRMPDAVAKVRGDALAKWCIDNADKYGIMYIIWQQRFYDMRTGAGWRMMSDRGGITANHYDHVHVSVL
ncbi:coiled-coil domain-containing protein [Microtetraspora malaysiensis]|uniref:Coiled-coil domain-containing protein n=1 Tax=Microtetraspora malaysiensis TaxID=161358 RepID=A0ABW6SXE6_9ACTN